MNNGVSKIRLFRYENYILVSQHTKMLGGTYPKYLKTKRTNVFIKLYGGKKNPTHIFIMERVMLVV